MALTVQNLRAVGTGVEPASLLPGQIAFNITDKVLYVGDGSNFKTAFDGTQTPGVPGAGWYAMPMDFSSLGDYYVANPGYWGDVPTDQQVLTWSTALNHPIWTSGGGGGGGNQVYVVTNAQVASASGATTSDKITAAIGVASPDEGDVTIVTGLPDDVYEGLYFFTTEWVKGAAYAYPSASEVIYDNTVTGLTPTVQGAIDDLDAGLAATTAIANTANSTANSALSIANAALPKAGGTMTGAIVARNINVQSGYSVQFDGGIAGTLNGISDSVSSGSSNIAASSAAVRSAYLLAQAAVPRSSFTGTGELLVGTGAGTFVPLAPGAEGDVLIISGGTPAWVTDTPGDVTSVTGTTPINVDNTDPENPVVGILAASTSQPGAVQLYDLLVGGTNTQALTASAGTSLQSQIDNLTLASNVILGGTFDCVLGHIDSTTAAGVTAGLTINSNLPFPALAYNDIYVVVTVPGPYSPPGGGGPYNAESGDWFLCGETGPATGIYVWQYLGVGARPAYATTGSAGIIQLSDDGQTQGGVSAVLAVTPSTLQSKLSDSTSTISSTTIASSTAVKSAYDLANAAVPATGGTMTGDLTFLGAGVGVVFSNASTVEAISDSTSTTSSITAASSTAVKAAYDLGVAALPTAGGTMTGAITFVAGQVFPVSGIQDATTGQKGIVQIGTNIDVSSGTISVATATTAVKGLVQVGTNIDVAAGTISVKSASTTQSGIVQLNDTVTSTSTTQALTANQGYNLQQQINALATSNNLTFAGTIDGSTGLMETVTVEGAAVGFAINSALPTPASAINEYFVIVSVAGTMTPPGGVATTVYVGDWWLASSTTWTYIAAGFQPPYASTTTPGLVRLSTNAETQAGTDATEAVTPASLQSKVSDSVSTTSSTAIASSTAVKSAYDLANAAVSKTCYTALGSLVAGTGASTIGTLPIGTTGQFLAANTGCTTGLEWCTISLACVPCSAYTGKGVLLAGTGSATFTALPVGTNGQVLVPNSSCAAGLEWITTSALSFQGYTCTATPFNTAFGGLAGDSITSGTNNTSIGYNAGTGITTGSFNVIVGSGAGSGVSIHDGHVAVGYQTLIGALDINNSNLVAIGTCALRAVTTGQNNLAIGFCAGATITTGGCNIAIGARALDSVTSSANNIGIGFSALTNITNGSENLAIGTCAGAANTTASNNTSIGYLAGCATATNGNNTYLGAYAGRAQTSVNNTAVGACALANSGVNNNTGIGFNAGAALTTGGSNTFVGAAAGDNATTADNTVAVGYNALSATHTAAGSVAVGANALAASTSGVGNVAVGFNAGSALTTGACNVFIGHCAGDVATGITCAVGIGVNALGGSPATTGTVAIGAGALATLSSGDRNTAIGFNAGTSVTLGIGNTLIGYRAGDAIGTSSNNTIIGNDAGNVLLSGSNNVLIGTNSGDAISSGSSNTVIGSVSGTAALANNLILAAGSTIKLQVNENGAVGVGSTPSYGTSGQILSSTGTAGAAAWTSSLPQVTAPTASTDAGVQGQIASDSNYFYMYTGGRWQRIAWDTTTW